MGKQEQSDSGQFVVAVTMTKDIPTGLNIVTRLNVWTAASIDEAVGKAVQDAQELNPEHQLFSIAKMSVPEPHRETPQ